MWPDMQGLWLAVSSMTASKLVFLSLHACIQVTYMHFTISQHSPYKDPLIAWGKASAIILCFLLMCLISKLHSWRAKLHRGICWLLLFIWLLKTKGMWSVKTLTETIVGYKYKLKCWNESNKANNVVNRIAVAEWYDHKTKLRSKKIPKHNSRIQKI